MTKAEKFLTETAERQVVGDLLATHLDRPVEKAKISLDEALAGDGLGNTYRWRGRYDGWTFVVDLRDETVEFGGDP